jgi:hypothetical protein
MGLISAAIRAPGRMAARKILLMQMMRIDNLLQYGRTDQRDRARLGYLASRAPGPRTVAYRIRHSNTDTAKYAGCVQKRFQKPPAHRSAASAFIEFRGICG